jgi:hypothetical protein
LHGACMGTSSKNLVPQLARPQTAGLYWWDEQQARQPSRGGLRRQQDSKHGVG